jgi:hypothetical protein
MATEDKVLVCMRADAEYTTRGSKFDSRCARCNARVMVAPTGQRLLRKNKSVKIICEGCLEAFVAGDPYKVALPAPAEEFLQEFHEGQIPNPNRNRN